MTKEVGISPKQIYQAVNDLLEEKEQLQQRIDKAIEYIKRFDIEHLHECMEHNVAEVLEDLDEILGGKQ